MAWDDQECACENRPGDRGQGARTRSKPDVECTTADVVCGHPFRFNLPIGATETVVLARAIDVCDARQVLVRTRVHSATVAGSGSLRIRVYAVFPSSCDPSLDFKRTPAVATHEILARAAAGTLLLTVLDRDATHAPSLRIEMDATSAGNLIATLSVDLVLRS